MKKIRVLFCPVNAKPYIVGLTDTMETMKMAVGGKVKAVKMLSEPHVLMLCNSQNAGELNRNLPDMSLFGRAGEKLEVRGNVIFCGVNGKDYLTDLQESMKRILKDSAVEAFEWTRGR